jgi:hypothetical protein
MALTELADKIEALAAKATSGPFDTLAGSMVRAIRGDCAIPILESRSPYDWTAKAPTVRQSDGSVLFRAGTLGAAHSRAFREEHANLELVAALLNNLPAILAVLRARSNEGVSTDELG